MLFGHAEEKPTAVVARNEVTRQSPSSCYKGGNISFGMEIAASAKSLLAKTAVGFFSFKRCVLSRTGIRGSTLQFLPATTTFGILICFVYILINQINNFTEICWWHRPIKPS